MQAFSKFIQKHQLDPQSESSKDNRCWQCCSFVYTVIKDFHHHVATVHRQEILDATNVLLAKGSPDARWKSLKSDIPSASVNDESISEEMKLPCDIALDDVYPWLPEKQHSNGDNKGRILLFYKYRFLFCYKLIEVLKILINIKVSLKHKNI